MKFRVDVQHTEMWSFVVEAPDAEVAEQMALNMDTPESTHDVLEAFVSAPLPDDTPLNEGFWCPKRPEE